MRDDVRGAGQRGEGNTGTAAVSAAAAAEARTVHGSGEARSAWRVPTAARAAIATRAAPRASPPRPAQTSPARLAQVSAVL